MTNMDRFETERIGRQEGNVVAAKAAFQELESKLNELGRTWEPDLRSYGIPIMDSRDAVQKVNAIRAVVTRNKRFVEKPNLMQSEAEQFVGQSSTFSSSLSYINYLLEKKRDSPTETEHRDRESTKLVSVKNARKDILILLDTLARDSSANYSSEKMSSLRSEADELLLQAEQGDAQRDAALTALEEILSTLRKDALANLYEKEHAKDAFPQ